MLQRVADNFRFKTKRFLFMKMLLTHAYVYLTVVRLCLNVCGFACYYQGLLGRLRAQ